MKRLNLAIVLLLAGAAPAAAAVHGYDALTLDPRGREIAAVERDRTGEAKIVVRSVRDGAVIRTYQPCSACGISGLTWSHAGNMLAFVTRDRSREGATLMVASGTSTRVVATIGGLAANPRFSPDDRHIALLVTLGATKETGATQAGARQVGEIGEKNDAQQLAIVDIAGAAGRAVTPLSPAGRYIYEYDWAPDGRWLAVTSALGNGDANWWVATLDRVDATTGAVTNLARPEMQLNMPRVSPDGRTIAFIGGLMSDFGSIGGDIYTVPAAGGAPLDITKGATRTYVALDWTLGGLRAAMLEGDRMGAVAVQPGAAARVLFAMPVTLSAGEGRIAWDARGGTMASVVQDFTHAPAIYAGAAIAPRQITHDNDAEPAAVRAQSVTWTNEGYTAQGWLLSPLTPPAAGIKAPMIVSVHGGPSAASTPRFLSKGPSSALADAGYYVFLPNPRGSYGQGEAFTAANRRDFGGGDLRDILAGIDAVEKVAPVDDARLGLTGCSYGGFMAMWANTQTHRFKAIVAGAGLSNWVSYYGTNGINTWMTPFFGASVYDDYKAYEDVSAVYHVKNAKTPTFIYVGERDIEVPPTQSVEYWHGLHDMGVPTSLVIYPEEGHGIRNLVNAADVRRRTLAWFDTYLAEKK